MNISEALEPIAIFFVVVSVLSLLYACYYLHHDVQSNKGEIYLGVTLVCIIGVIASVLARSTLVI